MQPMKQPSREYVNWPFRKKVDWMYFLPTYQFSFRFAFGFTNVARNQAGIASKDALADTSVETFMNVMRVNTLSYVRGFFRSRTSTFKPHLVVFLQ